MVDRLVSAKTRENEEEIEQSLRPRRLAEYIGQEKLKEHVQIMLEAAQQRKESLDHVLLFGPPGDCDGTLQGEDVAQHLGTLVGQIVFDNVGIITSPGTWDYLDSKPVLVVPTATPRRGA